MSKNIPFHKPYITNLEISNIKKVFDRKNTNYGYQGKFSKLCNNEIKKIIKCKSVLLTSSCTGALDIITKIIDLKKGDEVIIPSFNFVSAVDTFSSTGAKIVFCDIDNNFILDLNDLQKKITNRTKAIVLVHYNGNSVDFDELKILIGNKNIFVIEDAAAAFGSKYKNKYLGTIGDFGTYSCHESKNLHCGTGGALIINNEKYLKKSKLIWNRGTNREDFEKKKVNKYQWVQEGKSSHLSEMQAAFLFSQLKSFKTNLIKKKKIFLQYYNKLKNYTDHFDLPKFNIYNDTNFHTFFLVLKTIRKRKLFLEFMNKNKIQAVIHYEPLHASRIGKKIYKKNDLKKTFSMSKRIVRLPNFYQISNKDISFVVKKVINFLKIEK